MNRIVRIVYLIVFICLGFSTNMFAQSMSNVRVDELSDSQIRSFINQVQASGLPDAQIEQVAIARGMANAEVQKLRERVNRLKNSGGITDRATFTKTPDSLSQKKQTLREYSAAQFGDSIASDPDTEAQKALDELKSRIFGASLFKNANPQFVTNLNIATPKNYVVGTGDVLNISIYGYSEAQYELTVTPEGSINIPNVGVIMVAGATIEQASTRIKNQLAKVYTAIGSGNTRVNITVGNIRSINVILTGEIVRPGTYTLPSLASVFNALYASGGPTENGTMRDIRILRNGRVVSILDVYDFLVDGSLKNNIILQDQDVIFVPAYHKRVELIGEVKRPALFEIKNNETFQNLLDVSGGFTEYAYQDRVQVLKNTRKERRIEDLLSSQFAQYSPESGDKFMVSRILERFENRVVINGAVFRPGAFELSPGLTLSMLIKKADGVTQDAFLNLGTITRQKEDLQSEQLSFNVAAILAGTAPDIPLRKEDVITISSIFDLRDEYTVEILGEVRIPGSYAFSEGRTVKDLIFEAGGFKESASPLRVEISRRMTDVNVTAGTGQRAKVYQVNLNKAFEGEGANFILEPFDLVVVRTAPGYETQKTVQIEGEVLFPGVYSISKKDERITDLITRAGGFTPFAYVKGASLKREAIAGLRTQASRSDQMEVKRQEEDQKQQVEMLKSLQQDNQNVALSDTEIQEKLKNDYVGVDFNRILENPNNRQNLLLKDGDVVYVPKEQQTVDVGGEVLSPVTAVYLPNRSFKDYISQAGGFTEQVLKKRAYVVYANGSVQSTKSFLGIKTYPKIEPGAQIYVPKKKYRERQTLSAQAWVGLGSAIASMAAVIVTLLK
ncbi:SLBB domain-containing protein [Pedobacter sp. SAFR-022]|uniref:SLBB domain-containing protein n=1 Tax=Pedobacter sp. SAFR-022 TaxID=3436861 RepID=UPI003F7E8A2D